LRELLERLLAGTAPGRQPLTHVENLPARAALLEDDRARVLYLAPTEALAGDQLRVPCSCSTSSSHLSRV